MIFMLKEHAMRSSVCSLCRGHYGLEGRHYARFNVYELLSIWLSLRAPLMVIDSANQSGYADYFKRDAHRREHYGI